MTGYDSKRQMAANKLWDRPSVAFDEWWNNDHDESTNPFRLDSGAYWAWAGWKAALTQPAQEPVARITGVYGGRFTYDPINRAMVLPIGMALYSAPPQREWVGLTEDEWSNLKCKSVEDVWIALTVQAKLKEKNG